MDNHYRFPNNDPMSNSYSIMGALNFRIACLPSNKSGFTVEVLEYLCPMEPQAPADINPLRFGSSFLDGDFVVEEVFYR